MEIYWKLTATFNDATERWYITETQEQAVDAINDVFKDLPRLAEQGVKLVNLNMQAVEMTYEQYRYIPAINRAWWAH